MADYYSILDKTISGLSKNTAEMRAMVYEKARGAIQKQLRSMDPPPSEEQIAGQLKQLEDAIVDIDADYTAAIQPEPEPPAITEKQEPVAKPESISSVPEEPKVEPEKVADRPGASIPVEAQRMEPETASIEESFTQKSDSTSTLAPAPEVEKVEVASSQAETRNEPPLSQPVGPSAVVPSAGSIGNSAPATASAIPEDRPLAGNSQKPQQKKSRMLPYVLAYLLIVGMLIAGGFALWTNKDALLQGIAGISTESQVRQQVDNAEKSDPTSEEAESEADPDTNENSKITGDDAAKEPVRLGENGEDIVAEPVESQVTQGETEVPLVLDQSSQNPEQAAEVQPVEEAANDTGSSNNSEPVVQPISGDAAYLYEEGGSGEGASRSNGSIVWSLEQQSPEIGLPEEPVIVGKMDVPDKGLVLDMKIKRNTDPALSASHIIELEFEKAGGNPGDVVDNVARFVMKTTEAARGEQLVAVPVRIDTGFFLIALNNLEQAIKTNTRLMQESEWIDIPVGYSSGRRALVTLEKGETGKQVFQDAFSDWQNR